MRRPAKIGQAFLFSGVKSSQHQPERRKSLHVHTGGARFGPPGFPAEGAKAHDLAAVDPEARNASGIGAGVRAASRNGDARCAAPLDARSPSSTVEPPAALLASRQGRAECARPALEEKVAIHLDPRPGGVSNQTPPSPTVTENRSNETASRADSRAAVDIMTSPSRSSATTRVDLADRGGRRVARPCRRRSRLSLGANRGLHSLRSDPTPRE